jgi:predicted molibdopterin-dependent oxidoreductase YjgC
MRFTFDGQSLTAPAGSTIAAALLRCGVKSWRRTRSDKPRGIFCGIGNCYDCLVDVGEQRAVRACLTPLRDGDEVRSSDSRGGPYVD